jgi:uncharacterized protein YbgA (DUF1722 family)/uncharacterized protein YbbK (DUF523 family)
MHDFPKPVVVVSKCLGFAHCRYNGQTIPDHFVEQLRNYVEYRPVCPEVEIGLGIPRDPVRIVIDEGKRLLYQPATGKDATDSMQQFNDRFLQSVGQVDGFILKNRSPSCGPWDVKVYSGTKKEAAVSRGSGFFGGEVLARFPGQPIEDEGRLRNFTIREHFLTRLFALTRFRLMKADRSMRMLVEFHSRHKYLLMAYNQAQLKLLGAIVANHEKRGIDELLSIYEIQFTRALVHQPRFKSMINVLHHAYGGLAKKLQSEEKRFFLNSVEEYRDERIPLSALLRVLEAWSIGQGNRYLLDQVLLRPYPLELVEITDSGKGRKY